MVRAFFLHAVLRRDGGDATPWQLRCVGATPLTIFGSIFLNAVALVVASSGLLIVVKSLAQAYNYFVLHSMGV
jgi:hypothetical protein